MTQTSFGEIRAAVLREPNGPFVIEKLTIDLPGPNEVLVRIVAAGMCHTDLAVRGGDLPTPLPVVLGHEGAGIVEAVGPGVQKVAPGDPVVLTFPSCGLCDSCLTGHPSRCFLAFPLYFGGARLDGSHGLHCDHGPMHDRFFAQSSFATYSLATERNVVKVPKDAPLELLGPLACGVQTGAGAVLNSLRVRAGETFAVFGSGSVGLSAVMAARLCGAQQIIAIDVLPSRLELAKELGATHVINSREQDACAEVRRITGVGVHHALDTTGRVDVIRGALDALRPGGVCGVLGASAPGSELSIDVNMFIGTSRMLRGIVEGDSVPDIFIPQLIALHRQGAFPFDRLLKFYAFEEINEALRDSETGTAIKPVIRIPK